MGRLNSKQKEAAEYISGPLLVLAGAGSGKTRVITEKIAYLINHCDLQPRQILAVTFTNKAAREMKKRVAALLGKNRKPGLRISTFHTFGLNLLSRELDHVGRKPGFSIMDSLDSQNLIKDILHSKKLSADDLKVVQWAISKIKSSAMGSSQLPEDLAEQTLPYILDVYESYQRLLKTYNAFDFDDLILEPVKLFREHPDVLEKWQNRIRYILVDEYQDTNAVQYELVKQLTGVRGALTVVGDDDQSIYAWRGAQPENLALLQQHFPSLHVVKLEQNYRSTGNILRAANELISNNAHMYEKSLWSKIGPGDQISVVMNRDDEHEVEWLVSDIIHHHFSKATQYREYAILYRSNHQSRLFEKALREHRIPYFLSGGTSFFAMTEVKDVMAYLRLLVNPDDDSAFVRVVNTPKREIGAATVESLANYAAGRGISLFTACFEMGLEQNLSAKAYQRLNRFVHWLVDIGDRARRGDPLAAIKDLIKEIDYEQWLDDSSKDSKAAQRRMENVNDLIDWIERLLAREQVGEDVDAVLGYLSLMDIIERQDEENDSDRVHLMTLHGAKGLEFPYVYIIGVEEGCLPHHNSLEDTALEEERRLAYVGITRAQRRLVMTCARKRKRQGEWQEVEPSRFLKEIPQELLSYEGALSTQTTEQRKRKGQAQLSNLRSMLAG